MSVPADEETTFNKLLDEYKSNYVQFVGTGNQQFQKAYENARNAIHGIISGRQSAVDKERADMKHFVGVYKKDGDSLGELQDRAGGMYVNAQKIQDSYETSKKRYDNWLKNEEPAQPIDYTNGYGILWRVGLLALLLLFIVGISFYNPTSVNQSFYGSSFSLPSFGYGPSVASSIPGTPRTLGTPGTPGGLSVNILSPAWGSPRSRY
jgi:hypothetical protein